MRIVHFILILCLVFTQNVIANNGLSEEAWKTASENIDYTETYKEFKVDTTPKENKTPPRITNKEFNNPSLLKGIVIIVIGAALLALIIILIISVSKIKVTQKVSLQKIIEEVDDPDQYKLSDLEKYLQEALAKDDYRLAIRIRFLMLIKSLKEKEIIIWRKEKTNKDYYNEVKTHSYNNAFMHLINIFEKVWYAGYSVEKITYEQLAVKFINLQEQIDGE